MATPERNPIDATDLADRPEKTVYILHGKELASRGRRLGALAIDSGIIGLIVLLLFGVVVAAEEAQMPVESAGLLTGAFLVFYHILMWTAFSATPGKMMLRLQIVDRNGWRIGIVPSVGRLFGYGVSMLGVGLGFVWIFFDRFGRGWHDYIAGTYVIYEGDSKPRGRNMADDFFQDLAGGPPRVRQPHEEAPMNAPQASGGEARAQVRPRIRFVDVEATTRERTERRIVGDYPVASFSQRMIAFGLDLIASLMVSLVALFVLSIQIPETPDGFGGEDQARNDAVRLSIILALLVGYLVYPVISNWLFRSTAGKRIMNLQVVDRAGAHVGLARLLVRNLGYLVSAPVLFAGFISVLFDDYSQSWHDKLASTYVTYTGGGRVSDQDNNRRLSGAERRPGRSHWPTE